MALGGGTFLTQNKVLPGSYINVISLAKATANLSDRGYCTMPLELDWGVDDEVFTVEAGDFQKNSLKIFGYDYTHVKLKGLRDLFLNASTLYAYRLNSGEKAANEFATAKYSGIRGNDLLTIIQTNIDDESQFDVSTLISTKLVDKQTVTTASELKDNDFVNWKNAALELTAGTPLTGGTNGIVTGANHQDYLGKIESYTFNTMGVACEESIINNLYVSFTKRLRDEVGMKFQTVLFKTGADYEGVVNIKNDVLDDSFNKASLVFWVTGLEAGCLVNKSCLNRIYPGEFQVDTNFTQTQLINCVKNGEFTLHKVNDKIRVLMDINSLVSVTEDKGDVFKENQTMRVADQIANDTAVIFATKYLGVVPNDKMGRTNLWNDIVKHRGELLKIRAIQDFTSENVTVTEGETKKAVVVNEIINIVNAMGQLYMTTTVI